MISKFIINTLSSLQGQTGVDHVVSELRKEISRWILKFFIGFILSSIIVFSSFQLSSFYQNWLKQFQDGPVIGILSYSVLAILCAVLLYLNFKDNSLRQENKQNVFPNQNEQEHSAEYLALRFAEGFIEGLEKR